MIKFNLLKFLRVDLIQEMFNLYREQTGITMAFALQRILQEEDEYSCSFCKNCIKKSKKGKALCNKIFQDFVKTAKSTDSLQEFRCHAGLVDIIAPVKINDEVVTFLVSGQFVDEKHDLEKAKQIAKELEIDEEFYLKEYKKVKYVSKKEKEIILKLVEKIASGLSAMATRNYKENTLNNRRILSNYIIESINSFSKLEDIFQFVCKELTDNFDINSAKIFEFNFREKNYKELATYSKLVTSPDLSKTYDKKTYKEGIMKFWSENILDFAGNVNYKILDMKSDKTISQDVKDLYIAAGITNVVGLKLNTSPDSVMILCLIDNKADREWTDADRNYFEVLSRNLAVAVKYNILFTDLCNKVSIEKNLLDGFDFPAWLKDVDGNYIKINKAFCNYFNTDQDILPIKLSGDCNLSLATLSKIRKREEDAIAIRKHIFVNDIIPKEDGTFLSVDIYPVSDARMNISGTVGYIKDI
ncbi:MAG: PocR ligand-binding domain-containing protein [bacterium]|nr:PocR ligand-binding domain-containing protein [bacterium]